MIFHIEFFESSIVELSTVIDDDYPGQTKSIDDGFLKKAGSLLFCYLCQWFNFYPLSKVVNGHNEKFYLSTGK